MPQLLLDLDRPDRNVNENDARLKLKGVARAQRAAILLMSTHPSVISEGGIRRLRITYDAAASWCRANLKCAEGMRLDRSAFRKAVKALVERGVMAVSKGFLWLHVEHLREWYEMLKEPVDTPDFKGVSAPCPPVSFACPSVSAVCPSVSVVCPSVSVVSAVSASNDPMNNYQSFIRTLKDGHTELLNPSENPLNSLPELPDEAWQAELTKDWVLALGRWWKAHGLKERFGEASADVGHIMVGLIDKSRGSRNPAAYFHKAKRNPAPYLLQHGRQIAKSVPVPVPEPVAIPIGA